MQCYAISVAFALIALSSVANASDDDRVGVLCGVPDFNLSEELLPGEKEQVTKTFHNEVPLFSNRESAVESSWTTGVTRVRVFRLCWKDENSKSLCPGFEYENFFKQQQEQYSRSSGGRQILEFHFYELSDTPHYTRDSCSIYSGNCFGGSVYTNTVQRYYKQLTGFDRYIFVLENYCACLRWAGLGQINGRVSWINGRPTLRTVGHELGHNNGALHANVHQREYRNDLSIMGASNYVSDFTAVGKVSWNWLSAKQNIVSFGRDVSKCSNSYLPCAKQCTKESSCIVDLYAHDACLDKSLSLPCALHAHKTYAIRIDTPSSKSGDIVESLWLEYRTVLPSGFSHGETGIQMVWSTTVAGNTRYGPTQYFDYIKTTSTLADGYLPEKKYFVYDLDNVGAVIYLKRTRREGSSVNHYAQVEIFFSENTAQDYNYALNSRFIFSGSNLFCGETNKIIRVEMNENFRLYHLYTAEQSSIEITISSAQCENFESLNSLSGVYVYGTYPLAFELDSSSDPRNNALLQIPLTCKTNTKRSGIVDIKDFVPVGHGSDFPKYRDFSQSNYILVYKGDLDGALEVDVSISETPTCYTDCLEVKVSGAKDTGTNGNYHIKSREEYEFPVYVKESYVLEVKEGKWVFLKSNQLLYKQEDGIQPPKYPNLIPSLFPEITIDCSKRIDSADEPATPTNNPTNSPSELTVSPPTVNPWNNDTRSEPPIHNSTEETNVTSMESALNPDDNGFFIIIAFAGTIVVFALVLLVFVPYKFFTQSKGFGREASSQRSSTIGLQNDECHLQEQDRNPFTPGRKFSEPKFLLSRSPLDSSQTRSPLERSIYPTQPIPAPFFHRKQSKNQHLFSQNAGGSNNQWENKSQDYASPLPSSSFHNDQSRHSETEHKVTRTHSRQQNKLGPSRREDKKIFCSIVTEGTNIKLLWSKSPSFHALAVAVIEAPSTHEAALQQELEEIISPQPQPYGLMKSIVRLFRITHKCSGKVKTSVLLHKRFSIWLQDENGFSKLLKPDEIVECGGVTALAIIPTPLDLTPIFQSCSRRSFLKYAGKYGMGAGF